MAMLLQPASPGAQGKGNLNRKYQELPPSLQERRDDWVPKGPLAEAAGAQWKKTPQKAPHMQAELAPLQEEQEDVESGSPTQAPTGSSPMDDDDDPNVLDNELYTRLRPFKLEAAPGCAKHLAETMISTGSVPRPPPSLVPAPADPAGGRGVGRDLEKALEGDQVTALISRHGSMPLQQMTPLTAPGAPGYDPKCENMASLAPCGSGDLAEDQKGEKYDIFLSHLQRNAQDTIISLQMFLKEVRPCLKFFIDVDVEMTDGLHETLRKGVLNCRAFLFFITDGILGSMWCAQELRWAVEYGKNIVLVRETDARHGGIEMKDFFEQVPEDLMPVFKNNIAIPWYREKGFRGVSVHTILKRAALEDENANELQKLQQTKKQLMAVVKHAKSSKTAFDIVQQKSWTLKIVIWMGGFATFKGKWAQRMYDIIFNLSFWTCGVLCTLNLFYQDTPYHNFPTDALTAYVHLPACQSWLVWHRFVKSQGCADLMSKAMANKDRQAKLDLLLRFGGWLVLIVQCAMVSDVLFGFSLPRTLELADKHSEHKYDSFCSIHALMMWAVIPPVIAAMFASYVMFGFIAALHILDIMNTKDLLSKCIEPLAGYYDDPEKNDKQMKQMHSRPSGKDDLKKSPSQMSHRTPRGDRGGDTTSCAESSVGGANSAIGDVMDNIQEFQRQAALEESLFRTVAELLVFLIDGVQTRIDHTCNAVGGLWLHLVFFSTAQVLAISASLEALGTSHANPNYLWWWGLQDFFHLGGGIVLLVVAMGVFCIVTAMFSRVPHGVFKLLAGAGVPVSRQASVVSLLGTRPLGMRVAFGFILVDMTKAAGFFFVIGILLMDKVMLVLSILTEFEH